MFNAVREAIAQLFENWSDGSNDPGDLRAVSDAIADLVDQQYDDELDAVLSKPYVAQVLGFLADVIRP
jgi:hypothetical protein